MKKAVLFTAFLAFCAMAVAAEYTGKITQISKAEGTFSIVTDDGKKVDIATADDIEEKYYAEVDDPVVVTVDDNGKLVELKFNFEGYDEEDMAADEAVVEEAAEAAEATQPADAAAPAEPVQAEEVMPAE